MIRVSRVELVLQVKEVHQAELVPQGNLENRVTLVHQAKLYVKHLLAWCELHVVMFFFVFTFINVFLNCVLFGVF